ncbi:MAG: hypothetical protein SFY80_15390 [Verrucomicrobiota bacterium]|nr:hypothetical protein [Verrucomicrobiota bacterium]
MLNKIIALCCLVMSLSLTSLQAEDKSIGYFDAIKAEAAPVSGETYYLRHCLMFEKDIHKTTNYWRGTLLPINTQVKVLSLKKDMVLKVEKTGQVFTVKNVENFSRRSMVEIAHAMLTRTPVPIEKFEEDMAKQIASGNPKLGMTREQLVMTRGYPPGHKTPSLDSDKWIYWTSKLVYITYVFENGVIVAGRGL